MSKEQEITSKIQELIDTGKLPAGERLPAERKLCEMLGVSRGEVRKALQKLEFSGVVHTKAQSGSYVTEHYFSSLVATRILLEGEGCRLCAQNRTQAELEQIFAARDAFAANPTFDADVAFHRSIMAGTHNNVLCAVWQTVAADVATYYQRYSVCDLADPTLLKEHADMVDAISRQNPQEAADVLARHLDGIRKLSLQIDGV